MTALRCILSVGLVFLGALTGAPRLAWATGLIAVEIREDMRARLRDGDVVREGAVIEFMPASSGADGAELVFIANGAAPSTIASVGTGAGEAEADSAAPASFTLPADTPPGAARFELRGGNDGGQVASLTLIVADSQIQDQVLNGSVPDFSGVSPDDFADSEAFGISNPWVPSPGVMQTHKKILGALDYEDLLATTRGSREIRVFNKVSRSVVFIVTPAGASGSGTVIKDDGTILTSYHVVEGNPVVAVFFMPEEGLDIDPSEIFVATVLKVDEVSDLALLALLEPKEDLRVAELADFSSVKVGADVYAIGHPKGETWSLTRGIISQYRDNYEWGEGRKASVIQTQTPLNPGNSGGPLLTVTGKLLGVNDFVDMSPGSEGLNYAISIKDIKEFLDRPVSRRLVKPKILCGPVDLNKNQKRDGIICDYDGDGTIDVLYGDADEDGAIDFYRGDRNGDGTWDVYGKIVSLGSGIFINVFEIDNDQDGVPDAYAYDYDGDWRPDRYRPA